MKTNEISKPNNLITIDSSTNSIAFAHFIDGTLEKYGKIIFNGKDIYEKINDSSKKINAYAKLINIDCLVIESSIFANSQKTAIQLSLIQGSIIGAFGINGATRVIGVTPMQWQNWIGNKRLTEHEKQLLINNNLGKSASWYKSQERVFRKQRTINLVNKNFNLNVNDNDIADAIAIGWFSYSNWIKISS